MAGSQIPLLIKTTRSVKIPDSTKLSNRSLLKFKHWEITIHTKLHVNHDHFETEEAKIFYIYDRTEGDAQEHLYSHCKPDALWPFKTVSEVIQYLAKIYRDPYRVWNAVLEYQTLKMKIDQPFHEFKTRFLQLADEAEIADFISLKPVTCFNCSKVEHFASSCPEPRRLSEVKEIEGGEENNEQSGKEDA